MTNIASSRALTLPSAHSQLLSYPTLQAVPFCGGSKRKGWKLLSLGEKYRRVGHRQQPPDVNSHLTGKDRGASKDWGQEERVSEDEMAGWHHWSSGCEFEQTLGDGKGQGSLLCCSPWGHKESDMTEQLNSNKSSGKAEDDVPVSWEWVLTQVSVKILFVATIDEAGLS